MELSKYGTHPDPLALLAPGLDAQTLNLIYCHVLNVVDNTVLYHK